MPLLIRGMHHREAEAACEETIKLLGLDQNSGKEVLKLFEQLNEMGNTIVMITHDLSVARHAGRVVSIVDGMLTEC